MRALDYAVPFASIMALVLVSALPWGLPTDERFFLPLLPVVAIHYWANRRPQALPEWLVFLAGFLLDVFTHGPLGYWGLVYLSAYVLGIMSNDRIGDGFVWRIVSVGGVLAGVAALGWAIASVYFLEFADWRPYARGAALAFAASLAVIPLLHLLAADAGPRDDASLRRRS